MPPGPQARTKMYKAVNDEQVARSPGGAVAALALALTLALALALALAPPLRLTYPYLQPLVFDVELLSVMDDLLDRGDYDDGDPYLPRSP